MTDIQPWEGDDDAEDDVDWEDEEPIETTGAELVNEDEAEEPAETTIEHDMEVAARLRAEAEELIHQIDHRGEDGPGSELVVAAGAGETALATKKQMAKMRSTLARKQAAITTLANSIQAKVQQQLEEVQAMVQPMQERIERLQDGILAVNLYLGRDEQFVPLLEGALAPADTTIVIRQLVLSMDQECAVALDEGGIDARNLKSFDAWLKADWAHVEQILPEPKGLVVLVPRTTSRRYSTWAEQQQMDKANRHSYWLIRNGGTVMRMSTDFAVGKVLVPLQDEFTEMFMDQRWNPVTHEYDRVALEPGSYQWEKAEAASDERRRHFYKSALVIQGLLDRTTVFHPLPAPTVSVLTPESYDAGHVAIITDAEFALTDGHRPFKEWLPEQLSNLKVGERVIVASDSYEFRELRQDPENHRITPNRAPGPDPKELHQVSATRSGGFVISYPRVDHRWAWYDCDKDGTPNPHGRWRRQGEIPYKTKASLLIYTSDQFVLPIDRVDPADLRYYLSARHERHNYLKLVPLMKRAIQVIETEQEAEAPLRLLLIGEMAKAADVSIEDATADVAELIIWWKFTNKWHRPLVTDDPKVVSRIVEEYLRRRKAAELPPIDQAATIAKVKAKHPDAMFVGRARTGEIVVFTPAEPVFGVETPYVHEYRYTAARWSKKETLWTMTGSRRAALAELWADDRWRGWDHTAHRNGYLSGPEADAFLAAAVAGEPTMHVVREAVKERGMTSYKYDDVPVPADRTMLVTAESGRRITVWYLPSDRLPKIPTDLGTARMPSVDVLHHTVWWERKHGDIEHHGLRPSGDGYSGRCSKDSWGWRSNPWGNNRVLWANDVVLDRGRQAVEILHLFAKKGSRMEALADTYSEQVEVAWDAAVEQAAYDRFIEDYADPELWEGHRKTIKLATFGWDRKGPLKTMLTRLIERGLAGDIPGKTVGELRTMTAELPPPPVDEDLDEHRDFFYRHSDDAYQSDSAKLAAAVKGLDDYAFTEILPEEPPPPASETREPSSFTIVIDDEVREALWTAGF